MMTTLNRVRLLCVCLIPLSVSWPTAALSSSRIVVIDPGHGGAADAGSDAAKNKSTSNNATSATLRIKEKDLTLTLSQLIAQSINKSEVAAQGKIKAVLTRRDDSNLDFAKRAGVAAQVKDGTEEERARAARANAQPPDVNLERQGGSRIALNCRLRVHSLLLSRQWRLGGAG